MGSWRDWEWAALQFFLSCDSISDLCQQSTEQSCCPVGPGFSSLEWEGGTLRMACTAASIKGLKLWNHTLVWDEALI